MTGHRCVVFGCNDKPRKSGKCVAYHMFPSNKLLRDVWVRRCGGLQRINPDRSYICSAHFKADDYENNRIESASWPTRFILKPTAVPSLNLVLWPFKTSAIKAAKAKNQSSHYNQRKSIEELYIDNNSFSMGVKKEINEIPLECKDQEVFKGNQQEIKVEEINLDDCLACDTSRKEIKSCDRFEAEIKDDSDVIFVNEFRVTSSHEISEVSTDECKIFTDRSLELEEGEIDLENTVERDFTPTNPSSRIRYHVLVQSHNRLLKRVKELENELIVSQSLVAALKEKVKLLKGELEKAKEQTAEDLQLKEGIHDVLSKSQIDSGLLKKKKVVWNSEDLSKAFTIRYFSSRCYTYLREMLRYPLPGISSLQRWVSRINLQQGVLTDILRIMKIAGHALTDFEKTTVLYLDEVRVRSLYEYDEIQDEVLGPHSTMQVVMARGLFSDWKQPVYIGFDKRMTHKIVVNIVEKLHNVTYNVVACVTNCKRRHVQLWDEFGISTEETYVLHPITNNRIYIFVDASHVLVLLHKTFIETGFVLEDEIGITKEPLEQLISKSTLNHGLTAEHIQATDGRRQNIELVKSVFAQPCTFALSNLEDKHLVIFIEKISLWFQLMTAYMPNSNLFIKNLYGCNLTEQNELLDLVYNTIRTTRCRTENNLQVFQRGLLISINSLKQLFRDMQIKYSVKHVLTYRLNLDSLEDLLQQARVNGNERLSSPLSSVYKIRSLILGNDSIGQQNSHEAFKNEYVLSKVLTFNTSINSPYVPAIRQGDTKMLLSFTEEDHLKYLAALIATKFKDKYPRLVDESGKKRNYILPFWLEHLSCGDLTKASKYWLMHIKQMDKMFTFHHGEEGMLKKNRKKVTKKLVDYVAKRYKNVFPLEIIKEFIVQRTLLRIMHCNIKLNNKIRGKKKNVH